MCFATACRRTPPAASSSSREEQLEAHLKVCRYGNFELTEAVRPSFDLQVVPSQGYRHDCFSDDETKVRVPVLMAAATKEELFETFLDLLGSAGDRSRRGAGNQPQPRQPAGTSTCTASTSTCRCSKARCTITKICCSNDGCTGIAVLNPERAAGSAVRRAQAADRLRAGPDRRSKRCSASAACRATTR